MNTSRMLIVWYTFVAVFPFALVTMSLHAGAKAPDGRSLASDVTLIAPDGTRVMIHRDSYGVPHIVGATERGVIFGQGFAAAQDRLFQMERNWRGAAGRLTEWLGAFFGEADKDIRKRSYTEEERTQLFQALPADLRLVFEAYRDGVNTYLDSMTTTPAVYKPQEFFNWNMERWTVNKSIAIIQFMSSRFGGAGGQELTRLREMQDSGKVWLDRNRPINDP